MILIGIVFVLCKVLETPVVGSQLAGINKRPWLVSVQSYNIHICEGTIISMNVILTAAHPIILLAKNTMSVRAGSSRVDSEGSRHKVIDIERHIEYSNEFNRYRNDIALLKVSPPLNFGNNVTYINLARETDVISAGTVASIAGWKLISVDDELVYAPRDTNLSIIDNNHCAKIIKNSSGMPINLNRHICTQVPDQDSCQNGAGGPLIVDGVQIGVVSWGLVCTERKYPGVYVNVASHHDWIIRILKRWN